jgi:purine-nucleoside phosphorylase
MAKQKVGHLEGALEYLSSSWGTCKPKVAIICGSGWGGLADVFHGSRNLNYSEVPGLSSTTIAGHDGVLRLCDVNHKQVLLFQGRRHWYEGEGWEPISFPVHLANALGVNVMILTNAAGGINADYNVGDLMILKDHINFMGGNPLVGPVTDDVIPRFPDQTEVYNSELKEIAQQVALKQNLSVREGVYLAVSGPVFETPAEIKAFRTLGADAVGMSTVPEAMLAHSYGIQTFALSCISNKAAGMANEKLSHQDVQNASTLALPKMQAFVAQFLMDIL